jgi:hypothetical protein
MTILIAPSVAEPITVSPALATSIMVSPGLSQGRAVPTRSFGMPLWDLAGAVPSLDQRFAEDRSLVDAVSGQQLITFSRVTDATEINSAGQLAVAPAGTARFDHHPTTGESLGLLVEEQRTNLLRRSEEFDAAPTWASQGTAPTVTANAFAAPNEATTAERITFNASDSRLVQGLLPTTSGVTYTTSLYARSVGSSLNRFRLAFFDQSAQSNSVNFVASSTQWQRFAFSFTSAATNSTGLLQIRNASDNLANDLYIWGAQLEAGATASSYIPTADTAVTRTADLADLISSAIANNIRSFYVEFRSPAVGTRGVVSLNDNTANERLAVITSGTDPRLTVHDGGVEQANINGGTVTANARTRVAVRIDANNFAISINGGAVVTDTSGTLPTVDRLMLGRTQAGEYLNAPIARFTGWTEALPDGTLQALAQ